MSNNQKYIPLPGGKECKKVNPFYADETECRNESGSEYIDRRKKYMDFEATNPTYAITEVMPEGETFDGKEIKYYQIPKLDDMGHWYRVNFGWQEDYIVNNNCPTKIEVKPIKPLKAIEPVNEVNCEDCNDTGVIVSAYDRFPCNNCNANSSPKPLVDVVENKETVEDEPLKILWCKAGDMNYPNFKKWYEANWQQSQSIEGIVGFVLEAAKYAYDYHANSQFPEMSFEDNCKNNLLQWMQGKGYTDTTHHNHASFVALVEGEIAKLWVGGNIMGANRAVYNTLNNLLTKIK